MRIKSLASAPDRAGRYRVVLEDDSVLRLYRQTVQDFGIYAGLELSDEALTQLQQAAGLMSAKMRAVRIISASSVSKRDLEHRLVQKGENAAQAKEAVSWLTEMSLLDDRKTAEQVVSHCIAKGYGIPRVKQALYEKRIPRELWEDVLQDYPDQSGKILAFLRSRLGESPSDKEVKRAVDALLRRGHSYGEIRRCLSQITAESIDFPED